LLLPSALIVTPFRVVIILPQRFEIFKVEVRDFGIAHCSRALNIQVELQSDNVSSVKTSCAQRDAPLRATGFESEVEHAKLVTRQTRGFDVQRWLTE